MENLISMEQFEGLRAVKIAYAGFVWDKDGSVYSVIARNYTVERNTPPYPFDRMTGFTNGTTFYEVKTEYIVLLLDLKEDLVFDQNGAFICKKETSDTTSTNHSRIFIRQQMPSGVEDIPITEVSLSSQDSYIRIFTAILSDFKDQVITPRHLTGPILYLLGQPIKALKPVGALGSPKGSSIASWGLSKIFDKNLPESTIDIIKRISGKGIMKGSKNTGRVIGRFVPYAGWALTAADAIYTGYELGREYGPMTMYLKRQREKNQDKSIILRDYDK